MNCSCAELRLFGVDLNLNGFNLIFGVVVNNHLQRAKNCHGSGSIDIKVISDTGFKQTVVNNAVSLGNTDFTDEISDGGGSVLFVGTKKQAQDAVMTEALRCGEFYVNERWLGGMLTNFKTIRTRIERLKAIRRMAEDGTFDVLPKKEVILIKKEQEKLEKNLGGIVEMKELPSVIFVVDPKKEKICVKEAHNLGITLVGMCDTNCDPEELDYVIPGNDDAIRAVKLIVGKMADAVIEAKQGEEAYVEEESAEAVAMEAEEIAAADIEDVVSAE